MNLPLAASASFGLSIHLPAWVLGGIAFAVALTIGMGLAVSLLVHNDWVGFGDRASNSLALVVCFFVYGLIPGLAGSAAWFGLNWWLGLIIGSVTFVVVYFLHLISYQVFEKLQTKKRNRQPRFRMEA